MEKNQRETLKKKIEKTLKINSKESEYFILEGVASNSTYVSNKEEIKILKKDQKIIPLSEASEILPLSVYSHTVSRPFICWPKEIKWID